MKILILGASGMIGHKMYQVLSMHFPDTWAGIRRPLSDFAEAKIFSPQMTVQTPNAEKWPEFEQLLQTLRPDLILNCIGVTLRKEKIKDWDHCLEVNSLFPHRLKCWAAQNGARVIQMSTDCVFDGSSGSYHEDSPPSAKDIYGRTKYLGEIIAPHCLTLRGSMIGHELDGKTELLEWTLAQKNKQILGYSKALYSGVTTTVMADLITELIQRPKPLWGLYQVSSEPISKYDLLVKISQAFDLGLEITKDEKYQSKKDLVSAKLRSEVDFICPSWDDMISQLAKEDA